MTKIYTILYLKFLQKSTYRWLKLKGMITLSELPLTVPGNKVGIFFYMFSPSILNFYAPGSWSQAVCSAKPCSHAEPQLRVSPGDGLARSPHWRSDCWSMTAATLPVCAAGLLGCTFPHHLPGRRPAFLPAFSTSMHADTASFFCKLFFHYTGNRKDVLNILLIRRLVTQQHWSMIIYVQRKGQEGSGMRKFKYHWL